LNGKTNVSVTRLSALASALGKKLEIKLVDLEQNLMVNDKKVDYTSED
jgi:hypothetical protein